MKRLTHKEKKAIQGILQGKSKRRAIMDAYDCKSISTADSLGQEVFKKDKVLNELKVWEEKERRDLLPKAIKKIEEILDSRPQKPPSWDIIQKASNNVINRTMGKEEDNATFELGAKFIEERILRRIINVPKAEKYE